MAAVRAGKYDEARLAFAQARAVIPSLDILWNLALAEEKSGHAADALGHFRQFDREASSEIDRAPVQKHIADLAAVTGHVNVKAPAGAQIYVDGAQAAVAPLPGPIDVSPGRHAIEGRVTGAPSKSLTLDVLAGQTLDAALMLDVPPASPGADATAGAAAPGAAATMPGAPPGETPQPQGANGPSTDKIVTVVALGGAAVAAAGIAIGFGVAAGQDSNKADSLRQQNPNCDVPSAGCQSLSQATSDQHNHFMISMVMWSVTGALAGGAAVTWFIYPNTKPQAAGVRVVPTIGKDSGGLTVLGSF